MNKEVKDVIQLQIEGRIMSDVSGNTGSHLHGGHVALLLGLLFWVFYVLQPYIDPTPENIPTQRIQKSQETIDVQNRKND